MLAFLNYLCAKSKKFNLICSIILIVVIWLFNHFTRSPISVLYLLPITQLAYCVGVNWALAAALITVSVWGVTTSGGVAMPESQLPNVPWVRGLSVTVFFAVYIYLLGQLKQSLDHEKKLARTDHLTGVANGLHFNELALAEIHRSSRFGRPFSVLYLDLDNFKKVNDEGGHAAGDRLLAIVGKTLLSNTRQVDSVARLGGDEFAVLLPEASRDLAWHSAKRLQAVLQQAVHEANWPVTFSIGVVTFESAPDSIDEMLKHADRAMYTVKNRGKNSIWLEVFNRPLPAGSSRTGCG